MVSLQSSDHSSAMKFGKQLAHEARQSALFPLLGPPVPPPGQKCAGGLGYTAARTHSAGERRYCGMDSLGRGGGCRGAVWRGAAWRGSTLRVGGARLDAAGGGSGVSGAEVGVGEEEAVEVVAAETAETIFLRAHSRISALCLALASAPRLAAAQSPAERAPTVSVGRRTRRGRSSTSTTRRSSKS